uniref:Large ribosomal subunit protein bL32m n=2 Tax=Zea mays TaxID=4577 RepID=A0A804LEC0_MAIZE|eukprot:XP_008676233.2 ribosomal protein L32 containing protein isoform X1 [Zea mays]
MAAAGWLRRAAAVSLPRLPSGLPLIPPPPSGPLTEAQSLVVPGLGAAAGPAMELMAVPKKKVSKYKKGLRNGPKALKPVPVIVRCSLCR